MKSNNANLLSFIRSCRIRVVAVFGPRAAFGNLGVHALLCLLALPVHAAPGDLDSSFGTGGKVTTPIGSGNTGLGVKP